MNRPGKDYKRDWAHFWVHFMFGFVFGGIIGLGLFSRSPWVSSPSLLPLILFVGVSAMVVGLLAGVYGDDLWISIRGLF